MQLGALPLWMLWALIAIATAAVIAVIAYGVTADLQDREREESRDDE